MPVLTYAPHQRRHGCLPTQAVVAGIRRGRAPARPAPPAALAPGRWHPPRAPSAGQAPPTSFVLLAFSLPYSPLRVMARRTSPSPRPTAAVRALSAGGSTPVRRNSPACQPAPAPAAARTYEYCLSLGLEGPAALRAGEQAVLGIVATLRRYPDHTPGQPRLAGELSLRCPKPLLPTSSFEHYPGQPHARISHDRRRRLIDAQRLLDVGQYLLDWIGQSQAELCQQVHEQIRRYGVGTRCSYPATGYCLELGAVSAGPAPATPAPPPTLGTVVYCATVLAPAAEAGRQVLVSEAELAGAYTLGLAELWIPTDEHLVPADEDQPTPAPTPAPPAAIERAA